MPMTNYEKVKFGTLTGCGLGLAASFFTPSIAIVLPLHIMAWMLMGAASGATVAATEICIENTVNTCFSR